MSPAYAAGVPINRLKATEIRSDAGHLGRPDPDMDGLSDDDLFLSAPAGVPATAWLAAPETAHRYRQASRALAHGVNSSQRRIAKLARNVKPAAPAFATR